MGFQIPVTGTLALESGQLVARDSDGEVCARLFVGPDGLVVHGELTLWQDEDPPKLRFASSYVTWRGGLGLLSWNRVRDDGRQSEVAWIRGSLAEDVVTGEDRGQVDCYVRAEGDEEPRPAWIVSDAYTKAEYGFSRLRMYVREAVLGLWKFS